MQFVTLNNGVVMPQLGMGTYLIPKENLSDTLIEAYRLGYRQFDTAWKYNNEREIAATFREHGIAREDLFITTKVNADVYYRGGYNFGLHRYLNVRNFKSWKKGIMESFERLETEYIDLFLVHFPYTFYRKLYRELIALYKEGRIRAIGVSNCSRAHIEYLAEKYDIVPAVNQIEISPLNAEFELVEWCQKQGITVEAMSTFSHYHSVEPRKEIFEHEILNEIARQYNKSVVQIVLRWMLQRGIVCIPKTWEFKHLKENISVFDFVLTEHDMQRINEIDTGHPYNYNCHGPLARLAVPRRLWGHL